MANACSDSNSSLAWGYSKLNQFMYQRTDLGGIGRVWLKRLEFLGNLEKLEKGDGL